MSMENDEYVQFLNKSVSERASLMRERTEEREREFPEIFKQFYPRIYDKTDRITYFSPKEPSRYFGDIIVLSRISPNISSDFLSSLSDSLHGAATWMKYSCPQIWLSRSIAEAILLTTPPLEISWPAMNLPYDSMAILIPRGTVIDPVHGDAKFVWYSRHTHINGLVMFTVVAVWEDGMPQHWCFNQKDFPTIGLSNLKGFCDSIPRGYGDGNPANSERELGFTEGWVSESKIFHILFGSILVMLDRPELVRTASLRNRVKSKKSGTKEFWSPMILGENYRSRSESHESTGNGHGSPRFHWVKGFYRDQPYGPKNSLRRLKWIEPFTRGDKAEAA